MRQVAIIGGGISALATAYLLQEKAKSQNIAIGILMALSMEAIMAVVTTINIHGYSDFNLFSSFWVKSYFLALPFALVMSPVMTILIKPKLDAYLAK